MPRQAAQTFSPLTSLLQDHVSPEMLWLESKWASLVSYGASVNLLKDVLPIDKQLTAETVRRHLGRVGKRLEIELADEQYSFVETSAYERERMPIPDGPITVGIDGGCAFRQHVDTYSDSTWTVIPVHLDTLDLRLF